jgi:hypothetical protein
MILPGVVKTSFPSFACYLRPVVKMTDKNIVIFKFCLNMFIAIFNTLRMVAFWDIAPCSFVEVD